MFLAFAFCITSANAQFTSVKVTNSSGVANLYVRFHGSDNPLTPCAKIDDVAPTGPLLPSTSVTYTIPSVTWTPGTPLNFNAIGFDLIGGGPTVNGPWFGFCPKPSGMFPYVFANGYTINLTLTPMGGLIDIVL